MDEAIAQLKLPIREARFQRLSCVAAQKDPDLGQKQSYIVIAAQFVPALAKRIFLSKGRIPKSSGSKWNLI